jgi:hypothetical protein
MTDLDRNRDPSPGDDARDPGRRAHHETTPDDVVGEATGGLAGAATGAALGSLGGPIGTIIGGIAGAVGGWWSGRAISEAASHYTEGDDSYYRSLYESRRAGGALRPDPDLDAEDRASDIASARTEGYTGDFLAYRPAYQLGHLAGMNPDYEARSFDDVEPDLRRGWTDDVSRRHGAWEEAREHARSAYERARQGAGAESDREVDIGTGSDTDRERRGS